MNNLLMLGVLYLIIGGLMGTTLSYQPNWMTRKKFSIITFITIVLFWFPMGILSWIIVPFVSHKLL